MINYLLIKILNNAKNDGNFAEFIRTQFLIKFPKNYIFINFDMWARLYTHVKQKSTKQADETWMNSGNLWNFITSLRRINYSGCRRCKLIKKKSFSFAHNDNRFYSWFISEKICFYRNEDEIHFLADQNPCGLTPSVRNSFVTFIMAFAEVVY